MMRLPESFLYGATVGAHQVEGCDFDSDWWRWEQRASRIRDGGTSQLGAGHLDRYKEDYALARKLGHNAICLSLSWARIQPTRDAFNEAALRHYRDVLECASASNLTPLCILHQVSAPAWFSEQGGWCSSDASVSFEVYARYVAGKLGDCCDLWAPIYEPEHYLTMVCRERRWPGASSGRGVYRSALSQLSRAHILAGAALREHNPKAQVGLSIRGASIAPLDPHSPWDLRAAQWEQQRLNMRLFDMINGMSDSAPVIDFIGLSFYGGFRVRFAPFYWRGGCALPVDAAGHASSVDSTQEDLAGFESALTLFARFKKPIYLTGMGLPVEDDETRCRFLIEHIETLIRTMNASEGGLDVRAWFHAALLDGFEWHHGYTRRQGLVHVKRPGLERTPNKSAWLFKDIAEHGGVLPGHARKYVNAGIVHSA